METEKTKGLHRPDFGSLRMRWLYGLGALFGCLGAAWVAESFVQESERYDDVAGARIEAVARSVSVYLDGDRLNELAAKHPEDAFEAWEIAPKDLVSMGDYLHQTALANQLTAPIRTLRVRNSFQSAIDNRPNEFHPGAMEVIVTGGEKPSWRDPVDYVPAMGAALFDSRSTTTAQGSGDYRAFAPVKDSWGETIGVAEVSVRSTPPLWSLIFRLVLWSALAVGVVFLLVKLIDIFVRRHCRVLEHLALETRRLKAGDRAEPVWVASSTRELQRIAQALEEWRTDSEARRWNSRADSSAALASLAQANQPAARARAQVQSNARAQAAPAPQPPAPVGARGVPLGQPAPPPPVQPRAAQPIQAPPVPLGAPQTKQPLSRMPGRKLLQRRAPAQAQPVNFDLGLLIQQAVEGAHQRARLKQLELRVLLAERLPAELTGDPTALLDGLSALLENAIKFTKQGTITLRVARVVDSYQLRFEVADTGIGVAWQAQPKLDQAIERAASTEPRDAKGGLLRTAAIAARMGGQLGFESQPGSGSRFWFTANFQAGQAVSAQLQRPAMI